MGSVDLDIGEHWRTNAGKFISLNLPVIDWLWINTPKLSSYLYLCCKFLVFKIIGKITKKCSYLVCDLLSVFILLKDCFKLKILK